MADVKNNNGFDTPVDSSENDDLAQEGIREYQYLFSRRGNWNSHWTEIAERIYPMHSTLFENFSTLTSEGQKRNTEVFDSTGIVSLQRFGAILDSLLTPRNSMWALLRANDDTIMRDKACRLWFEDASNKLWEQRYLANANFASQNQLQYKSLGAYGTGGLFIDDLAGFKGLRYRNTFLGELYLQENHQGIIDRVCRYFMMTARQAKQKFGDACPEVVTTALENSPEKPFYFIHWVKPNIDRDPFRKDFKGMAFTSEYISMEARKLVLQGGYRTFPYAISRYEQAPNEAYGRSPAMDVLPAIKTLNEQKKTMLKQGHRAVDPVLLAHDDGVIDAFNLEPGAINFGGITKDGRVLVQPLPTGNVQAGKDFMDEEQALIKDTFLVSIFQILTENPEMTATEVMERTREKGILLAPTVGRQQSEYLGPLIDRELDILARQGILQPMPKMLKEAKGQYKIVYDSPITRAQKAEKVSGAMRTMEFLGNYAQTAQDPSALDLVDIDIAGPAIADANGMPPSWIRSPADIQKIRSARAKAQQVQTAIQAAPAAAGIMKAQKP